MKEFINPSREMYDQLVRRPTISAREMRNTISTVFKEIELKGDEAVKSFTSAYDSVDLEKIQVGKEVLERAYAQMDKSLIQAIRTAKENIYSFHEAQYPTDINIEINKGIQLLQRSVPIERIGIYIPGGTAPLLSTILMLAIPARIAGCKEIVLCSPPTYKGSIHPSILATAHICGIQEVYAVGGAQAIAAMAIGTETIRKVMKVFGPGNQFVTAAKEYAIDYGVAMDLPAGPSELLVFADETSVPAFIAADLLSQAEHGVDSQVVLITTSNDIAIQVKNEVYDQVERLPRKSIATEALKNSFSVVIDSPEEAFYFINQYAPEHLIIASEQPSSYIDKIQNAGSVFLGNYCPESAGDYASGTNHTLPTSGWAKAYNGVNIDSYMKKITFQHINKEGLELIGNAITLMAREEQLEAHARAVDIRLNTKI